MPPKLLLTILLVTVNIVHGVSQTSLGTRNDFFSTTPISQVIGGTTASVLANDSVNGVANSANLSNVTLTWLSSAPAGFTLNSAGTISVAAGTAADNYVINYQICGTVNTALCQTGYATVYVDGDSDGDGISDLTDNDDDNDGILDGNECNIDLFAIYVANNFTDNTMFLELRPSDFGFNTLGAKNLNGSHDYSSFFGLPAGSIIATVETANVHPSANQFYVGLVAGTSARTRIKFSGTVGVYLGVEQGQQYIGQVERGITFLDGATGLLNAGTQTTGGNWQSGNIDQYYYVRHTATSTENAILSYANINSQLMSKQVEFSTNNTVVTEYSTFFIRIFPECDTDKDGIPNRLDLDADNDGCPDVFEGAGTYNYSHVVAAGGTVSVGSASTAQNINFCADNSCIDGTGVPIVTGAGGQSTGTVYDNSQMSNFCITSLPVEMLNFSVTNNGNVVQLNWVTLTEFNNRGFEIESSTDNHTWKTIGFVQSKAENGNSITQSTYNFTDNTASGKQVFYRLKQLDFDGKYEYSAVKVIKLAADAPIMLYPNPAKNDITIQGLSGRETIQIFDASGRKVKQVTGMNMQLHIGITDLSEGVFNVLIMSANGKTSLHRFTKSK